MWKPSGAALVVVFVVGAVLLGLLDSSKADDKPVPVKQRASAVAKADAEWVEKGEGKLTEADLIARLGPADELRSPGKAVADYTMVWRDRTAIRVKFDKDKKVVEYTGWFSDRLPHERITRDAFKKLKQGLDSDDVQELLSIPDHAQGDYRYWGSHRTLTVFLKDGKVAGYRWGQNSADGWD